MSCSDNNPIATDANKWTIFSSSFEANGKPDLGEWMIHNQVADSQVTFSNDEVTGNGLWAIKLVSKSNGFSSIETKMGINPTDSLTNYIITYWAKGIGMTASSISSSTNFKIVFAHGVHFNSNSWQLHADTIFKQGKGFDSLSISLSTSFLDSMSIAYFDNVQVVGIKQ